MRYPTILGATVLASAALVAAPAMVKSQTVTEKAEQKAEQAWQKTKDVTLDAKTGAQQKAAEVWSKTKSTGRDAKTATGDSWLTSKTKIALFADERVKGRQISVETLNGVVTLRGKVDSDEAKAAAASIAGGIEGVTRVRNDLQVVPPDSRKSVEISDDEITRQVENRLAKDGRLKSVDVRTDAGVVTLTGEVPTIIAGAHASEIAREVSGVRSVKNELVYEPAVSPRGESNAPKPAQVMTMQQALKDKGYDPGPIDGVMGRKTASALKKYQRTENLNVTGQMDTATAAKLEAHDAKR
jgi:hyperosmotically inducible protein